MNHFKAQNSLAFSTFIMLYSQSLFLLSRCLHQSKRRPFIQSLPESPFAEALAATSLSVFVNLSFLGNLYKRNPTMHELDI